MCEHDAHEHGGAGCEVFVRVDPAQAGGDGGDGRMLRLCPCPLNEVEAAAICGLTLAA